MITTILFYVIAAFIIFSSIKMVSSTNIVHSVLFMAAVFFGIAMLYALLNADYLAIVQIMVYVGAISVLFVFGVMLTKRSSMEESSRYSRYRITGFAAAGALFLALAGTVLSLDIVPAGITAADTTVTGIAGLMLTDFSVPLETSGLLLLTAVIGAIAIGKGADETK